MAVRIIAMVFIFVSVTIAWVILGTTVAIRTENQDMKLKDSVGQLWGTAQKQRAPWFFYQTVKEHRTKKIQDDQTIIEIVTELIDHSVPINASTIEVDLGLEHRRKGLLWYSTYTVGFHGLYEIVNESEKKREVFFRFNFPNQGAVYDNFVLMIGDRKIKDIKIQSGTVSETIMVEPGQTESVEVAYESQGLDDWWYEFGDDVNQIQNFSLTMNTDFEDIDFPQNSISPTEKEKTEKGWKLNWSYSNLLSGVQIGLSLPQKLNPGPWVSQITFFAPVSLFLFFFVMFVLTAVKKVRIHPMNYFFLGGAFFAFHLLNAYLVDHISIHLSFLICSLVSIFLVVSYMRLVVGMKFAALEVGFSQFAFLVVFSYTFFFEGYTGLAITILCIVTLFLVMQFTGKVDWEKLFQRNGSDGIQRHS